MDSCRKQSPNVERDIVLDPLPSMLMVAASAFFFLAESILESDHTRTSFSFIHASMMLQALPRAFVRSQNRALAVTRFRQVDVSFRSNPIPFFLSKAHRVGSNVSIRVTKATRNFQATETCAARCTRVFLSLRGSILGTSMRFGSARTQVKTSRRVRRKRRGRERGARRHFPAVRLLLRPRTVRLARDGHLLLRKPRKISKP